ncbi:hypothetical protein L195_g064670, partial [Trifolium pratense]
MESDGNERGSIAASVITLDLG